MMSNTVSIPANLDVSLFQRGAETTPERSQGVWGAWCVAAHRLAGDTGELSLH